MLSTCMCAIQYKHVNIIFSLAYIYSKVKAVAPAFPSADGGEVPASLVNVATAPMTTPIEEKVTTKRPKRRRKKTTTITTSTVVSEKNSDESNDGQDTPKTVSKRIIRLLKK